MILPFMILPSMILPLEGSAEPALKDAFKDTFLIGAALSQDQFSGSGGCATELIPRQFNSITPENILKWEPVHPSPGKYDFVPGDRYVAFGEQNHMFLIGHNLIWHQQTPRWVFQDDKGNPVTRDVLLARMRDHISTVVGRYKGKIRGWDVVNEALEENGSLRRSPWLTIIGEDYLLKAYQFAHEADPAAELYYNDYSLENAPKRKGAVELLKKLRGQRAQITGVGLQGHYKMDRPSPAQVDETIETFSKLGLKVMITELDIDVLPQANRSVGADVSARAAAQPGLNPYTNGLPDAVQKKLADRYAELFRVFLKHRSAISRVTFWGVNDAHSWLNYWPVRGRINYPLLFDRECRPKPAFNAVIGLSPPAQP